MAYDPTLADPVSRIRLAVGDTADTELLPDSTYTGALRATRSRLQSVEFADGGGVTWADLPRNGSAVWFTDLTADPGVDADTLYYVAAGDATALTSDLATSPTGDAIDLTADATGWAGVVDEAAATREIARALAARYAQEPGSVRLPNGLSASWADRVAYWRDLAAGNAGGAGARTARGAQWRRGPRLDYNAGVGDVAASE